MKSSDRAIVVGVIVGALAIAFYVMVLGPKRDEASKLNDQIEGLHASISQDQQVASFAEQARNDFPRYYGRLVVLGKAVPEQADTASMLVQLSSAAGHSDVQFRAIKLSEGGSSGGTGTSGSAPAAPATPAAPSTPSSTSATPAAATASAAPAGSTAATASGTDTTGASTAAPAASATSTLVPATESDAASQPIGATVGPAGLPTLPYELTLKGGFFDVANFIGGVDSLVTPQGASQIVADGRLMTVDGFGLDILHPGASPTMKAILAVTAYTAPATQGLTAGASPTGPAPVSPAQPASAAVAQ